MLRLATLMSVFAVAGCGFQEAPPPTDAVLRKASNLELCQTYSIAKSPYAPNWQTAVRGELLRRGAVTKQDGADWKKGLVRIGMSEHIAVCSWGPYLDVNTTTGSWGVDKQFVMSSRSYVYTRNGRVTSFQN